jgi:hypothetical protein
MIQSGIREVIMATVRSTIFDEVLDFLASAPTVEQILAFQPSEAIAERSHYLMEQNRSDRITSEERAELDEFLRINHMVNMLKAKARKNLGK